jgi:hypothetical protein
MFLRFIFLAFRRLRIVKNYFSFLILGLGETLASLRILGMGA